MERSPLYPTLRRQGAQFAQEFGWEFPLRFAEPASEYRAARERAALLDRSAVGRLRMTGGDALDLLNRLSTNALEGLQSGAGATTVLTTNKGRILDWLTVFNLGDSLLLLTSPQQRREVADWIDKYTIVEEVSLEDITAGTALLCLMGPRAAEVLSRVVGPETEALQPLGCIQASWKGEELLVTRMDPVGLPGFDLMIPGSVAQDLWDALLAVDASEKVAPLGEEAFEALRIQAGIPRYGRELTEAYNPLEAGLLGSISFTKGCYIGQEVVARLKTYRKVQKYLVRLEFDGDEVPPPGARLLVKGKDVGQVTSAARLPNPGHIVALGYVRAAFARPGTQVEAVLPEGKSAHGTVAQVPEMAFGEQGAPLSALEAAEEEEP